MLDITISSREIDVNVHPNKLSVRFRDDERVALSVTRAIAEALNSVSTAYPFPACAAEQAPCTIKDSDSDSASAHIISTTQDPVDMTTSMIMRNQPRMYSRTNQLSFERKL